MAATDRRTPNVLFAIADDWGSGHAGAYGCDWVDTPHFDRVAREGLLYAHAYTPNAKCAPSRASILTGRNPWQLGAAANHNCHFPLEFTTYPEALAAAGAHVGVTGKGWAPGSALDDAGRPRAMAGTPYNARTTTPPTTRIRRNDYAANFADFLDDAAKGEPWVFWYGGHEPHRPYEYGSGVEHGYRSLTDIPRIPDYWPDTDVVRHDLLDYALAVTYFDAHLGRMLDLLEERGELDDTLVIVTSDNGMPFPRAKGQSYEASTHLPFAVRWPHGIADPGRTVDAFVSFIDIAPTVLDVRGQSGADLGMRSISGQSLTDTFAADPRDRDHVLLGRERHDVGRPGDVGFPIRGIATADLLYLHNDEPGRWPAGNPATGYPDVDGSPTKTAILNAHRSDPEDTHWQACFGKRGADELYDLGSDPDCLRNVAGDPRYADALSRLRAQLAAELRLQGDPRAFGEGSVFEAHPYAVDGVRGMYERESAGEHLPTGWLEDGDRDPAFE